VLEPGHAVTLEDIHRVMGRAHVARFRFPGRLVTVPELVAAEVGKIGKKALRAGIAGRLGAEEILEGEPRDLRG
jgi:2,3-dihydroxybenzoate-AMP ligase